MTGLTLTEDAFLGGRVMITQPANGYRAGMDAVMLAASLPFSVGRPCRVLDVGAGVGTVGLCVARRCFESEVTLLEREPALADLARRNAETNHLSHRVQIAEVSIEATPAELDRVALLPNSFEHVLANPPYHVEGHGTQAPDPLKAVSHAMPGGDLDPWLRFMARMCKPGGTATIIHKADALPKVLAAFANRFGDLHVLPIHPRETEPANRILVSGIKGSRAPLSIGPGFTLHGEGTAFTAAAQAILRDGAGILPRS